MAQPRKQEFDIHNIEAYEVGSIIEDISDGDKFEREGEFKYQTQQPLSKTSQLVWLATNEVAAQRNAKLTKELGDSVFSGALSHQYAAETVVLKFAQGSMDKLRTKTQNEWIAMSLLANSTHAGARHIIKPLNYVYASTCAQLIENNQGEKEWERLGHNAFIVMPYVQGQRLFNMVKDLPEDTLERLSQVENYCQQLTTILSLLASTDTPVVHRDISPNNLLVDENKQLVLIDFDRCVLLGGSTPTVTEAGTPGCQSPEVDAKRGDVDSRADQYSIAAIIFNLLTGEVPDLRGGSALFAQIKAELSDKKRDFVEWIAPLSKAMSVNKEERYTNALDFEQAIKQTFTDYYARITFNPYQEAKRSLSQAENDLNALAQQLSIGIKTEQKDKEQVENIQTLVNAFNQTHSKTNNKILNNELLTELLTELKSHENSQGEWISQAQSIQAQLKQQLSNIAKQVYTLTELEQQATLSKQLPEALIEIQQGIKDTFWVEAQEQIQAALDKQNTYQQAQVQLQQDIAQALPQPEDTVTAQDNITSQSTAVLTKLSQKLQQQQAKLSGDRAHNSQQVLRNLSTYLADVESKHSKLNSAKQAHHSKQQSLIKQIASLASTDIAEQSEQVDGLSKLSQALEQLLTYQQNQEQLISQYQALLTYAWHAPDYWQKEWKAATKQKLAAKTLVALAVASSVGAIAYWSPFATSGPEVKSSITRTYQNEEVKILLNRELEPGGYQLSFTGANCDYKQSKSHKMSNVNQRGYVYFTCTADKFGEHAYQLLTPQGEAIQTKRDTITVKPLKHKLTLQVVPEHANVQATNKSNNEILTLTSGIRLYEGEYQLSSTAKDYHNKSETIEWLGQPLSINLNAIDNQAPKITLTDIKQTDEQLTLTVNAKDNKALKKLSVHVKQGDTVINGTIQNWDLGGKGSSTINWQYDLSALGGSKYVAIFELEDSNRHKTTTEHEFESGYLLLADKYYEGNGAEQNYVKAFEYYNLAAKQNSARAKNDLGWMYEKGQGVEQDDQLAVEWYRKSAEQGYAKGQRHLGWMYEYGRGVEQDYNLATKWYRKSAEQGDARGQSYLGWMYANGRGVEQDDKLAVEWYSKAAEQGEASAQSYLGSIYINGQGVKYDEALAIEWSRKSAEQENATGQRLLGWMYANGRGVKQDYKLAMEWYRKAAEQGEIIAQWLIGNMYEDGLGAKQDDKLAVEWYRKAAEQEHANGQFSLGWMYANGRGVGQDYKQAVEWYRKAAEQGDASGQSYLSMMYINGHGVEQDEKSAIEWSRKAAEQGDAFGQRLLGWMYQKGQGVKPDDKMAVEWYRKAVDQGESIAQRLLGGMYREGRGVQQDDKMAIAWYRKSAEQGDAAAQRLLGWMYKEGRGVQQDDKMAVEWYRKAGSQGEAVALRLLGWMYKEGRGVQRDDKMAIEWYQKAVSQGEAVAKNALGWMYLKGRGVQQDNKTAVKWFQKAAEQGDANGQFNLGWMYQKGRGVKQDDKLAIEWSRKAADQGSAGGQRLLGWMYANGRGVKQSNQEAIKWYIKAAEQGDAVAQNNLASMYKKGDGVKQDDKLAFKWYRKAAEQGYASAQNGLGVMYKNGRGVKKDYRIAAEWYQKAASQGETWAQRNLAELYRLGQGVVKDYKQAYQLIQQAYKQNNAQHCATYGYYFEKGIGIKKDVNKAIEIYEIGAVEGISGCQYNLGVMYANGSGSLWSSDSKAEKWYRLAADQGNKSAIKALEKMGLKYIPKNL